MSSTRAGSDRVSVVIPVFNRRREIPRAIASALGQSLSPYEILVVDDGSTDGSPEAVAAIGDPRIKLLRHLQNRGAAAARNTAIEAAQGDWIALLDSDDEWEKNKLALQLESLAGAPDDTPAGVTGYVIRDYRYGESRHYQPTARDVTLDALVWGCALGLGSTMLARRSIFREIGSFDPELPRLEDWEWLMRYLPVYRLGVLAEELAIVHKGSDPSKARVAASVARIRTRHRMLWYGRSWFDGRRFDSTLFVEEAAAAYFARDFLGATMLSLRALAAYPFRGNGFFNMVARRVRHAVR